jgi:hypothetical protein
MPGLVAIVENLDDVEEPLREHYAERDGKFVLNVTDLESHPSLLALKGAHERQKEENKKLKSDNTELKAKAESVPDDFDGEEWARLKALKEELEKEGGELDPEKKKKHEAEIQSQKKMHEQAIAKLNKKYTDDIAARDKTIAEKDKTIKDILVDGLTSELAKSGVQPHFLKAAKLTLAPSVKIVEENGKYSAMVETDLGPEPIEKFVPQWVQSDEGKHFVEPPKGGGAEGGEKRRQTTEKNPWSKQDWSMTEQGQIIRNDAAKAEKMAQAAGHKKASGARKEDAK